MCRKNASANAGHARTPPFPRLVALLRKRVALDGAWAHWQCTPCKLGFSCWLTSNGRPATHSCMQKECLSQCGSRQDALLSKTCSTIPEARRSQRYVGASTLRGCSTHAHHESSASSPDLRQTGYKRHCKMVCHCKMSSHKTFPSQVSLWPTIKWKTEEQGHCRDVWTNTSF